MPSPSMPEVQPKFTPTMMFLRYCGLIPPMASLVTEDQLVLFPGTKTYTLNNYLCMNPAFGGANDALKLKDTLLGATLGKPPKATKLYKSFGLSGVDLMNVFSGKGSPEQMELAMSMVDFLIRTQPAVLKGQFPDVMQGGLELLMDAPKPKKVYMGLDCNGFVGMWMRASGFPGAGPSNSIGSWPNGGKRMALEELKSCDVAAFENNQHIVCLDTVYREDGKVFADIVQSTGREGEIGGPQKTFKHPVVKTTTPGIFEIRNNGQSYTSVVFKSSKRVRILSSAYTTD
jgi:hypothetical protein